jgi:hypothetical protein
MKKDTEETVCKALLTIAAIVAIIGGGVFIKTVFL